MAEAAAAAYLCANCGERGCVDDEERSVEWYECDGCECWYHGGCLTQYELIMAVTSLCYGDEWTCKRCNPWEYEECGTVSMYLRLRARVKARVRVFERVREVVCLCSAMMTKNKHVEMYKIALLYHIHIKLCYMF
ncbi:hypothetical protein DPMN_181649 [Dreissena polymorpha]|uniref:PHD-type domain-containing protein n=1 Tax=Dreissena polymorpha TaxID=45954 RepID=A0A9D4DCR2_DREPO|nr:hypothetical protein DPMN_181649 [Dreissena polymorpha]